MWRNLKGVFIGVTALFLFLFLFISLYYYPKTFAVENPINISITTDSVLFQVANMKPGDWAERELTIQNRSSEDINYKMELKRTKGSEKLFKELQIEVRAGEQQLYNGSFEQMIHFEPRFLQGEHEESLWMRVDFPRELGNEYQGLKSEVSFRFVAEEVQEHTDEGDIGPIIEKQKPIDPETLENDEIKEGQIVPSTTTNNFNFLLIGVTLITTGFIYYIYNQRKNSLLLEEFDIYDGNSN